MSVPENDDKPKSVSSEHYPFYEAPRTMQSPIFSACMFEQACGYSFKYSEGSLDIEYSDADESNMVEYSNVSYDLNE